MIEVTPEDILWHAAFECEESENNALSEEPEKEIYKPSNIKPYEKKNR
jgi:hypothetical protein|nr:MAG TPA: hypothetical protein [Caudoviricetes sp.]